MYSDVLDYVDRENEIAQGLQLERKLLREFRRGHDPLGNVLKTSLLPYQVRGAIFASCRGRVVLADDMGLGKTVQALAATELLRRRRGIRRVLVVAPASVKYQWKTEIEKFTKLDAQVIEGLVPQRQGQYASPKFFNLTSYELVLKDIKYLHELRPDLIILDEAQRIRNWATATARTIKQLKSRYAFVLDGMRESRYHEYKRYFICLKAVAALGFESNFELARTLPVCSGSVGLWAIPISVANS